MTAPSGQPPVHRPLQFNLRLLLGLAVAVGLLFGTLRWLAVPPQIALLVAAVVAVSVGAALGLMIAIGRSLPPRGPRSAAEEDETRA